jgi:DNA-binding transcriptional ArsR family regulator
MGKLPRVSRTALTGILFRNTLPFVESLASVADLGTLQTLAHPTRLRILACLRQPSSAAGVARELGQSRQRVNYHVKELERAGLIRLVGERRSGNLTESLYEVEQAALENLVAVGERLQRSAALLLDRAAFDGERIAGAVVEAGVRLAGEAQRAAFLSEVDALLTRYGVGGGDPYRVVLAVHPDPVQRS